MEFRFAEASRVSLQVLNQGLAFWRQIGLAESARTLVGWTPV